jgi:hypothetical protein
MIVGSISYDQIPLAWSLCKPTEVAAKGAVASLHCRMDPLKRVLIL